MEIMTSPYKNASDSPSRQLLYELSRLGITAQENFYARLDRESRERETLHKDALAAAAVAHERIRRGAEIEREKLELQLQAERRRRDEEDQRELELRRRERAEREIAEKKQAIERARLAELEEKRVADARKAEAAAAEENKRMREERDAEIARRLKELQGVQAKKEETEKRAKKDAKDATSRAEKANKLITAASQPSYPRAAPNSEREEEHQRYIVIHRNLKQLRKFLTSESSKFPQVKQQMGEIRRELKKCVGQLTEGKGANRGPLQQIIAVLRKSTQLNEPRIDVTLFLASLPSPLPAADTTAPALLVYLLNIFAKAIIAQFIDEAGISPRFADPIGTIASHIFSLTDFRWQGVSLIDILIAKMHVVCPILWGIYGDETTPQGKARIGWWREEKDGPWVSEHRHKERMTGLGAGFAAIALRNYEKARNENPYPNIKYWKSFALIINTPPAEVTNTHFVVLKAMIENYETKFLEFFGNAALAALRKALVDFPAQTVQQSMAAKALATLVEVLRKEKRLIL